MVEHNNLSSYISWCKCDYHTRLNNTSLNTTDGHCSNTSNLVNILEGKSESLVDWSGWWHNGIKSLDHSFTTWFFFFTFSILSLNIPSLEPAHVFRFFNHVITMPSRDRDKSYCLGVVTNLLDVCRNFLLNFIES